MSSYDDWRATDRDWERVQDYHDDADSEHWLEIADDDEDADSYLDETEEAA